MSKNKKAAQVADLDPEIRIPTTFTEQGSLIRGMLVFFFGLFFFIAGLVFPFAMWVSDAAVSSTVLSVICALVFVGFGGAAVVMGLNGAFARRSVELTRTHVTVAEKKFKPLPISRNFRESLSSYTVAKRSVYHADPDVPYTEYLVELKHDHLDKNNVIVYRAYHAADWEKRFLSWEEVLKN